MQDFIIKLLDLKEEDLDSIHTVSQINQADFLITLKVTKIISALNVAALPVMSRTTEPENLNTRSLSIAAQPYSTDREDISAETAKNHLLKKHRLPETGIR